MIDKNRAKMNYSKDIETHTPVFSISAAAKLLGISVHTMRMYEKEGLIIPHKEAGHNRLYSQEDLERLNCIREAIKTKKYSIASIKAIFSFIPCWKLVNCPREKREECPAFHGTEPCWTYDHKDTYCKSLECRNCIVYQDFKQCGEIKKQINKYME